MWDASRFLRCRRGASARSHASAAHSVIAADRNARRDPCLNIGSQPSYRTPAKPLAPGELSNQSHTEEQPFRSTYQSCHISRSQQLVPMRQRLIDKGANRDVGASGRVIDQRRKRRGFAFHKRPYSRMWSRSLRVKLSLRRIVPHNRKHFILEMRSIFSETLNSRGAWGSLRIPDYLGASC